VGLLDALAATVVDRLDADRTQHTVCDLLAPRCCAIAPG
jgi:hypothetical protein